MGGIIAIFAIFTLAMIFDGIVNMINFIIKYYKKIKYIHRVNIIRKRHFFDAEYY